MKEVLPKNRLIEDPDYYRNIIERIAEELEGLAKLFDQETSGIRRMSGSWGEKAALLKSGEKLGSDQSAVREIVKDIADNAGLSVGERQYLLGRVFNPPRLRKTD
ncbi:MAG: hypothetical protein A3B99_01265 [Candidatus Yanofskybacteria bacterium RIFCSPHIGHO2_02_FULL_44_12b]|uniref:Uncharacterized protein n=1 Tax=Candidatus Yanofskybacteria bacterium RIFCSPLOWO2_01_FULL_44_22 TaxID=1802697 RepID=A0A1F8GJ67_9BACT|nr:MAG: hypothetical protein A2659_03930 [Candidatus Yanofskybacteria bacterium RIFCSPHIGHO2_01_FULL_44_24]OGN15458.1 MAG: hypothetical protein A3B99_01265 [Candidatus Yanofskybacteria bacterium RIFCSPHIGHO2_02_FULL_44_12b]OGN25442.1 MAG: hypothetical protein A2925_00235 [Candidatus Yanofskybacteria bacterium RIFCSPLOWO2_01_FULL_44_22]